MFCKFKKVLVSLCHEGVKTKLLVFMSKIQGAIFEIRGEKLVVVFPPKTSEYFLPYPENSVHDRQATIITQNEITGLSAYLQRGDCLFIPAFWFHRVESFTSSLSINFWSYSHVVFYSSQFFFNLFCILLSINL